MCKRFYLFTPSAAGGRKAYPSTQRLAFCFCALLPWPKPNMHECGRFWGRGRINVPLVPPERLKTSVPEPNPLSSYRSLRDRVTMFTQPHRRRVCACPNRPPTKCTGQSISAGRVVKLFAQDGQRFIARYDAKNAVSAPPREMVVTVISPTVRATAVWAISCRAQHNSARDHHARRRRHIPGWHSKVLAVDHIFNKRDVGFACWVSAGRSPSRFVCCHAFANRFEI